MNAKDARELATRIANTKLKENYDSVKREISSSVSKGEFALNYFRDILLDTEFRLKKEGYVLEEGTARQGEYNTIIKW